ncbi:hypothetical protein TCSYLVIO_002443 [Trypanosoma cruzi]|nr:hypothetical protein TCSYLVIO_002443 [Trypanosoma cruzi]
MSRLPPSCAVRRDAAGIQKKKKRGLSFALPFTPTPLHYLLPLLLGQSPVPSAAKSKKKKKQIRQKKKKNDWGAKCDSGQQYCEDRWGANDPTPPDNLSIKSLLSFPHTHTQRERERERERNTSVQLFGCCFNNTRALHKKQKANKQTKKNIPPKKFIRTHAYTPPHVHTYTFHIGTSIMREIKGGKKRRGRRTKNQITIKKKGIYLPFFSTHQQRAEFTVRRRFLPWASWVSIHGSGAPLPSACTPLLATCCCKG